MSMANSHKFDRRTVIKTVGAGTTAGMIGLAGCSGNGDGGDNDNGDGNGDGSGDDNGNGNGDNNDNGNGDESVSWTIGTSGEETATHASGVAFSSVINENSDSIEMSAQTTGGTTANNRLVDEGEIDIAQSTHNLLWRANRDAGPYSDPPIEKTLCQTFSYMTLDIFLVKRQEVSDLEGVTRVEDLPEGTSISFGPRGTSAWDIANDGLSILGIEDSQEYFDVSTMGLGDQANAMNDGRIDVCTCYTANQSTLIGWIQQLDAQVDIDILDWNITAEQASNSDVPVATADVPGDTWNQEISHDPYTALPLGYTTVIPSDISDDLVYEYTDVLMNNVEDVRSASAVLEEHGPDFATEWLQPEGVPVHPGSEQYYKDNDMWDESLTTLEEFEG